MKEYDLIAIGTGSAMNIVQAMLSSNPELKVAVVDKDDPGGICLNKACIPTKRLVYPADLVRLIQSAGEFGLEARLDSLDFPTIMERMRRSVGQESEHIRQGLQQSENVDYYQETAQFSGPYQMRVGKETISAEQIFLCLGSRPAIPQIAGLEKVAYHSSDTILSIDQLPQRLTIVGGGYVAAEFGHFFSAMGSEVTILGRNPQFLPGEEPEVSALAKRMLGQWMTILNNHQVTKVEPAQSGEAIRTWFLDRSTGESKSVESDTLLLASGRAPNTDLLHPESSGVQTDAQGWIAVNDYLETSKDNIWAFGDAIGKHLYKHVANYESQVVYENAVLGKKTPVDYRAVPHAVFTHPEIASVGLKEQEAVAQLGQDKVMIGFNRFEDTARGQAMGVSGCFAKIVLEEGSGRILGAHIIGPQASVLIQEIITLMASGEGNIIPAMNAMHIHPALSEVIQGALSEFLSPEDYQHLLTHLFPDDFSA